MVKGNPKTSIILENDYVRYTIGQDGQNLGFVDRQTGKDYCAQGLRHTFVALKKGGRNYEPSALSYFDSQITAQFFEADVTAVIKVTTKKRYFVFELAKISDEGIDEFVMSNLYLTISENIGAILNVAQDEKFAACMIALNLQVNSHGGSTERAVLWSACYPSFGLVGTKVALIGCPSDEIRSVIKEVVREEEFPYSPVGGAWALDAEETRGSYIFTSPSEEDINEWIKLSKDAGMTHIHINGWYSSLGHYEPHPQKFPNGVAGLKAVVDKIHAAGMKAGMHILTGCISKHDAWVQPLPDKRLAKDAFFTLAEPVAEDATAIPTVEPPKGLPTESGYWVQGGTDIVIDDEIIVYTGISTEPPYVFTGCRRGAYGTKAAGHQKGTAVGHLVERYAWYLPDGDSTLVDELAQRVADIFNTCGFDMIYFDGAEAMGAVGPGWHYVPKMKLAIFNKIKRRLLVEASSWDHHTWHIHSRLGAWDNACRGTKRFLDRHISDMKSYQNNLLAVQLGWWALHPPGPGFDATQPDEIEYLCAKCLGHDVAFSLQGVSPAGLRANPRWTELLSIMGRHEALRRSNYFPESIKAKLRVPGEEFQLIKSSEGRWQFVPVEYIEQKVTEIDGRGNVWKVNNKFGSQPLKVKIQALMSTSPYDAPEGVVLTDFTDGSSFSGSPEEERLLIVRVGVASTGVEHRIETSEEVVKVGELSGCYRAYNSSGQVGWSKMTKIFSPPLNLEGKTAIGVWIHGDGKGEVLNFQLAGVAQQGFAEHYVVIDYKGWRYHQLVEPEGDRIYDYSWPYWHMCAARGAVPYSSITRLSLYYNNIPPKETVACYLSPILALKTAAISIENPTITVGDKSITFPVVLKSGCYLEFSPPSNCKFYSANGTVIREVKPQGEAPMGRRRAACSERTRTAEKDTLTLVKPRKLAPWSSLCSAMRCC